MLDLSDFFREYAERFSTLDTSRIVYFYDKPCYIFTQDGFRSFNTISELKTNIEKLLEFYESHQFRSAQLRKLVIYHS